MAFKHSPMNIGGLRTVYLYNLVDGSDGASECGSSSSEEDELEDVDILEPDLELSDSATPVSFLLIHFGFFGWFFF